MMMSSAEELGTYYPESLKTDPELAQVPHAGGHRASFDWQGHLRHIEVFYQRLGI